MKYPRDGGRGIEGLVKQMKRKNILVIGGAGFDNFDASYPDANMILEMKLLGFRVIQVPAVMHMRASGKGMHAGIWNPVKYMVRSTVAVVIAWMRWRLLREGKA